MEHYSLIKRKDLGAPARRQAEVDTLAHIESLFEEIRAHFQRRSLLAKRARGDRSEMRNGMTHLTMAAPAPKALKRAVGRGLCPSAEEEPTPRQSVSEGGRNAHLFLFFYFFLL
jgi:hypothetical protein